MTVPHKRIWTKAQIACHALGVSNYYSIAGRIVSDADKADALFGQQVVDQITQRSTQGMPCEH